MKNATIQSDFTVLRFECLRSALFTSDYIIVWKPGGPAGDLSPETSPAVDFVIFHVSTVRLDKILGSLDDAY